MRIGNLLNANQRLSFLWPKELPFLLCVGTQNLGKNNSRRLFTSSVFTLKNKKILFLSLFWKKFPSKNCEISFKCPLRILIKLR